MTKIFLLFFALVISPSTWACLLTKGEIRVNDEKLAIHQKFERDQSYPFRTSNYLIHLRLLSKKKDSKQLAEVIIRHPKTFKILGQLIMALEEGKNVESSMESSNNLKIVANLALQHI